MRCEAVHVNPAILSGTPCISRVPVYMIAGMVWHHGVDEAMRSWDFSRGQVLNACWYAAVVNVLHVWRDREPLGIGTRREPWRKRWGAWAAEVHPALWRQDYEAVADPPSKRDADESA